MSELLTTGQMIDRLKVGEIAVGDVSELGTVIQVIKRESGGIKLLEDGFGERTLMLDGGVVDSVKWRIEPKCVSFEEAMLAMTEGKTVAFYSKDGSKRVTELDAYAGFNRYEFAWRDFIEGKWTIEE